MDRINFLIAVVLLFNACGNSNSNNEPKYRQHHSYAEFLQFLKHKTDSIDSDFEKTTYIRIKTAELIDRAIGGTRDAKNIDSNWASWTGNRYYEIFYLGSATVQCGGSAHFLNQVYNDLEYESETYDMGITGIYTHQITLVRISKDSAYYVQDAFNNITFEDGETKLPLSFNGLIQHLKNKNDSFVQIIQGKYEYLPTYDTSEIRGNYPFLKMTDSLATGALTRYDFAKLVAKQKKVYKKCFLPNGYPDNLLYLYLFPLEHNSREVKNIVL